MARIARVVSPGMPHHITQRGNRRQTTFFCQEDYSVYLDLLTTWCAKYDVKIWAYCLMPNHVHLMAVPGESISLRRAIGETHRRYTRHVNFREGWRGYLWQGRFASFVLDENYLLAAARYIELNPVRAGLVRSPEDYRWSSAAAHLQGISDGVVQVEPLLSLMPDWQAFLREPLSEREAELLRRHARSGRPLGSSKFVSGLEKSLKRTLRPQKPGPKRNREK